MAQHIERRDDSATYQSARKYQHTGLGCVVEDAITDAYFIRHTFGMDVRIEDMRRLWGENRIFIHFPGEGPEDTESLDFSTYKESDRPQIRRFTKLANEGGYVWAHFGPDRETKIGKVLPATTPEFKYGEWRDAHPGRIAKLKTLRLTSVQRVAANRWLSLRVCAPPHLTISRWPSARERLEAIVEARPIPRKWNALFPAQQETLCAEYLRGAQGRGLPRMTHLLLPVGRTLEDIDIYGIAEDGRYVMAQVTFSRPERVPEKVQALQRHTAADTDLVFFGTCDALRKEDGVTFVPVQRVWEWAEREAEYLDGLLDA